MKKLKVFDVHIHFCPYKENYNMAIEQLLQYSEKNNVVKMCLISDMGKESIIEKAFSQYPEKFIGYAHPNLDLDEPRVIKAYYERGFKGLKVINTERNYDDPKYFKFYEIAEQYGMVILFHTGVIGGAYDYLLNEKSSLVEEMKGRNKQTNNKKKKKSSSARMRSIFLDTIAINFPDLKMIGAHLGWPEYMMSCALARWRKNLYFDISGGEVVQRHIIEGNYINKEISTGKLVFGTDASIDKMPIGISNWYYSLRSIGLLDEEIEKIFYFNAAKIFGIGSSK
jgi:predicted TIM-barrel fold metal-dependent hydrolase